MIHSIKRPWHLYDALMMMCCHYFCFTIIHNMHIKYPVNLSKLYFALLNSLLMLVSSGSALGAENTELPSIWWAAEKYSGWVENVNLNLYLFKTQTSWPVCVINTVDCNLLILKIRSYCTYSTEILSHFCEWNTFWQLKAQWNVLNYLIIEHGKGVDV